MTEIFYATHKKGVLFLDGCSNNNSSNNNYNNDKNDNLNFSNCCGGGGIEFRTKHGILSTTPTKNNNSKNSNNKHSNNANTNNTDGNSPIIISDESDLALLAREMNSLSVQEREKVFNDIHGVAEVFQEESNPNFIPQCLTELDVALERLPRSKRRAYEKALFLKPTIQTDTKFKLMFLRAELYNPKKAALRIAKYYTEKLEWFGETKLVKQPLTLDDLQPEDVQRLNLQGSIVLPHKDQTGRPILFYESSEKDIEHSDSMLRVFWYQTMTLVEDEDDDSAQLKGVIDLVYFPGNIFARTSIKMMAPTFVMRMGRIIESLPFRMAGYHFCINDPRVRYVVSNCAAAFGKNERLRIRTHFGSDLELQYSLMTFGITCHYLFHTTAKTYNKNNNSRNQNDCFDRVAFHKQYIQQRQQKEQKQKERLLQYEKEQLGGMLLYPSPDDVLVGRGRPFQEYTGNQRLGTVIESQVSRHQHTTSRFEKTCIHLQVIKMVQDYGGRFIQKATRTITATNNDGSITSTIVAGWTLAPEDLIRKKIVSAFRYIAEKNNNNNNIQQQYLSETTDPPPIASIVTVWGTNISMINNNITVRPGGTSRPHSGVSDDDDDEEHISIKRSTKRLRQDP